MNLLSLSKAHKKTPRQLLLDESEALEKPQQRRHELWLLSCYVDLKVAQAFIREVADRVRVTDVYLTFDYSEVYRLGPAKLKSALGALRQSCTKQEIQLDIRFLAPEPSSGITRLVHSKGYAIVQRVQDRIEGGVLLLGSANLTKPGFSDGENAELGYISRRISELRSFEKLYNQLWDDYGREEISDKVLQQNDHLFRYALLSSGRFLHKWAGNLRQLVGIRYRIINPEKWAQLPKDLEAEGFELSNTLTRQPLALDHLPKRTLPGAFTRNFTIETAFGRWCPKVAWDEVADPSAEGFIEAFQAATTEEILDGVMKQAADRQQRLVADGLIAAVEHDHLERWRERVLYLREVPDRLARLYTGYEDFPMPLDAERKTEIDDLYDSLVDSIGLQANPTWTSVRVVQCIKERSCDSMRMDDQGRKLLKQED